MVDTGPCVPRESPGSRGPARSRERWPEAGQSLGVAGGVPSREQVHRRACHRAPTGDAAVPARPPGPALGVSMRAVSSVTIPETQVPPRLLPDTQSRGASPLGGRHRVPCPRPQFRHPGPRRPPAPPPRSPSARGFSLPRSGLICVPVCDLPKRGVLGATAERSTSSPPGFPRACSQPHARLRDPALAASARVGVRLGPWASIHALPRPDSPSRASEAAATGPAL